MSAEKTESGNKVRIWASGGLYTPIKKRKENRREK